MEEGSWAIIKVKYEYAYVSKRESSFLVVDSMVFSNVFASLNFNVIFFALL